MDKKVPNNNRRDFIISGITAGVAALYPVSLQAGKERTGDWGNKVILITGATSGLGKYLVSAFAKLGSKVIFCGRRKQLGLAIESQLLKAGSQVAFFQADIQKEENIQALIEFAVKKFGRIDLAINNAGIEFSSNDFAGDDLSKHIEVIQTNLVGTMICLKYELQQMLKQNAGSIVNIGSVAGVRGSSTVPSYSASKHGVIGLTKSLGKKYAAQNIRINAVSPYLVDHQIGGPDGPLSEKERAEAKRQIPAGNLISLEDIFQGILWLGSEKSGMVMGFNLLLDGAALA